MSIFFRATRIEVLKAGPRDRRRPSILFGERLWLIDWETSFRNDPLTDVAIVAENLPVRLAPLGVGPELGQKWARTIPAALHSRLGTGPHVRAEIVYEAERAHLKVVLLSPHGNTAKKLDLIRMWLDQSG